MLFLGERIRLALQDQPRLVLYVAINDEIPSHNGYLNLLEQFKRLTELANVELREDRFSFWGLRYHD